VRAPHDPVGRRRHGERPVGEAQHHLADRCAFGFIGVQQRRIAGSVQDAGEFPAEVDRVLDAGVHTLGAGRAVDMRGVPGEKDQAGTVVGGGAVLEPEIGHPHRIV